MNVLRMAGMVVVAAIGLAQAHTYTLDELVNTGCKTSQQIKIVEEELTKTDAQIREAYGNAFPKIDLSANYSYAFKQYSPFGSMSSMGGTSISGMLDTTATKNDRTIAGALDGMVGGFAKLGEVKNNTMALTLSLQQPLFAQGKVSIGLKIARIYKEGLQCKYDATKQSVMADITKLFYAALLAQKNLAIQEEAIKLAQESHRLAKVRLAVGKGSELDTLVSSLNNAKAQIDLQNAQSKLTMAKEALIKQTGVTETAETFAPTGEFPATDYFITLDEALAKMKQNNKQLLQLQSGEAVQNQLIGLVKTDYLPLVYCGGSIGKISQFKSDEKAVWGDNQSVFVGASINLFNGGVTTQKVKQAQCNLLSFQATMQQATDGLELAVKNAYENLESSRKTLAATAAVLALAEKGYTVAKKSYEVGLSTLLDMQKTELELKGARMALNAAQFAFTCAVVDMKTLTSTLE